LLYIYMKNTFYESNHVVEPVAAVQGLLGKFDDLILRLRTVDASTLIPLSAPTLWVAEFDEEIICSGRLEPVRGTRFAGIWGGATLGHWRGKGIYRALTAARARSAIAAGKTLIHSDSTEFSRPILERAGFLKVSETTPYIWLRGET
jgi:hypothetical protein